MQAVGAHRGNAFRGTHLVAAVLFRIVAALRAVVDTVHVPPPPPRWANEFRKFLMQFHAD